MANQTRFEVQTLSICDGWINSWFATDKKGTRPVTFASYAAAEAHINEYLDDVQLEIETGERGADEGFDRNNFRIVEINRIA